MHRERQPSGIAEPLDELLHPIDRKRRAALADEHETAVLAVLTDQSADQPKLVTSQAMLARNAVFGPVYVENRSLFSWITLDIDESPTLRWAMSAYRLFLRQTQCHKVALQQLAGRSAPEKSTRSQDGRGGNATSDCALLA
jgi:hypothetical protein